MRKNPLSPLLCLLLLSLGSTLLTSCSLFPNFQKDNPFTLLHYNIFELDSEKINEIGLSQNGPEQLSAVKKFLEPYSFDLLSINELQYDLPGVPYPNFKTEGLNLKRFTQWLRPNKQDQWQFHFVPSNTGNKAKKVAPSTYATSRDQGARFYADPDNYGLFPAQYSTGLSSRFPIVKRIVIQDLPWKVFNPEASLHKYLNGVRQKLPQDIPLFDKAFMDTVVDINGRQVHIITLHTVPAYHFGNKKSPNYHRNYDQLRFLEWYLTGKTDRETKKTYAGITPLTDKDIYIAVGDWNTDKKNRNPGASVLTRFEATGRLLPQESITWEGQGYSPDRLSMGLDYIFYSHQLNLISTKVLRPEEKRILLGCDKDSLLPVKENYDQSIENYKDKNGNTCYISVSKDFKLAKTASDHFPLWAEFSFKQSH